MNLLLFALSLYKGVFIKVLDHNKKEVSPNCYWQDETSIEIEWFVRSLLLMGPLTSIYPNLSYNDINIRKWYIDELIKFTDWKPQGPSQGTVEVATLCILLKECNLFKEYNEQQQLKILQWMEYFIKIPCFENNWQVFRITIFSFLKYFKFDTCEDIRSTNELIDSMYAKDGFYHDGREGQIDFYNGWVFHFYIPLISTWNVLDQDIETKWMIRNKIFLKSYESFFDGSGMKMFGRSICYRFASVVPFVLNGIHGELIERVINQFINCKWLDDGIPSIDFDGKKLIYCNEPSPMWCFKIFIMLGKYE